MKIFEMLNSLSLALLMGIFWSQGSIAQTGNEDELSYWDQVQIMYVAYYGRPGDAGGLDFWAAKLEEGNGNLSRIIDSFGNSKEFQDRFGNLDDEELVNNIFLQLLGRDADSGGLNFYVNGLREGRFTLASIALNVADGTKGLDAMIKANKLRAANAFTETYVEIGANYNIFQIDDAKRWLAGVGSSDTSVTAALDRLPGFFQRHDPFARFNNYEPQPWWRESAPYSCLRQKKQTSPWLDAGLMDPGGSDPLSLIRYFGNGSYLRYGRMGFSGCTRTDKDPNGFHLDAPADPTYYSLGELDIWIDIARVPKDASRWSRSDDGTRVEFSMEEAVVLLNRHVARYYRRVSEDNLRITFHQGNDFEVGGDGGPAAAENQSFTLAGACPDDCTYAPGGLNRILFNDVEASSGGRAFNGWATLGLVNVRDAIMETIVHEIGHGWMAWPHSYAEVPWRPYSNSEIDNSNPYSNHYDIMSALGTDRKIGWESELPSTLAINRYAAGWINPENVALHLDINATYTLNKPFDGGYQFLVIQSGRPYAFTTLEVLEERSAAYREDSANIYDPSAPGGFRSRRYDGVLVSRYDQTTGTGVQVRFGPAFYNRDNPQFLADVGWGRDDSSLMAEGETRDIGGGVSVAVAKNRDGSYDVTVSGGRVAGFETWCRRFWFVKGSEYDTGCFLDEAVWE